MRSSSNDAMTKESRLAEESRLHRTGLERELGLPRAAKLAATGPGAHRLHPVVELRAVFRDGMALAEAGGMPHRSFWNAASGCIACTALACGGTDPVEPAPTITERGEPAAEVGPALPEPADVAPEAPSKPLAEPPSVAVAVPQAPAPPAAPCVAPEGTNAAPRDIEELVALMNALPKPTTVACLLSSLERPLEIYATRSELSAQPASGAENPRTFLVLGPLLVSIVPGGASSHLVELGYRTTEGRSIKAEIAFPLTREVTAADLFERVQTGRVSMCSGCHANELRVTDGFFSGTEGAFESAVIPPLYFYEVDLETYRAEVPLCDTTLEPERCGMLNGLFEHGEVRASTLWAAESPAP
jgi:hypothetical protein